MDARPCMRRRRSARRRMSLRPWSVLGPIPTRDWKMEARPCIARPRGIVTALVEARGDPHARATYGCTPLHLAAQSGTPGQPMSRNGPVRLEFPILSLNPGLRPRGVAPDVWGRRVAGGGAAAIVEEAGRHAGRLTGGTPRRAPAVDGDAVAVEDQRAIGITARPRRDQPSIGC